MKEKKEALWWLFWLPNIIRYLVWPGLQFAWSAYAAVRAVAYLALGFLATPVIRLGWNTINPDKPMGNAQALLVLAAGIGLAAFLAKTQPGSDLLGALAALTIIAGCFCWLLLAALPALALYAYGRLRPAGSPGKTAYAFYLGPIEWADRRFFLSHRTGN